MLQFDKHLLINYQATNMCMRTQYRIFYNICNNIYNIHKHKLFNWNSYIPSQIREFLHNFKIELHIMLK